MRHCADAGKSQDKSNVHVTKISPVTHDLIPKHANTKRMLRPMGLKFLRKSSLRGLTVVEARWLIFLLISNTVGGKI